MDETSNWISPRFFLKLTFAPCVPMTMSENDPFGCEKLTYSEMNVSCAGLSVTDSALAQSGLAAQNETTRSKAGRVKTKRRINFFGLVAPAKAQARTV